MRPLSSLDWTDFLCWIVCAVLIYASLNFRITMVFKYPGKKLRAQAKAIWDKRLAQSRRETQRAAMGLSNKE